MKRSGKVIFLAHCIVNQNCVVKSHARAKGAYIEILEILMERGIGMEILPCPETIHLGLNRPPMPKEDYDTRAYRSLCHILSLEILQRIKAYQGAEMEVLGILGIQKSPSCDSSAEVPGVFMEELRKSLNAQGMDLPCQDISKAFEEGKDNQQELLSLQQWLEEIKR